MEQFAELLRLLRAPAMSAQFASLYGKKDGMKVVQVDRYSRVIRRFADHFGEQGGLRFFSAPGRVEIGGNHTDHNHGQVLAAAITLDSIAAVSPTSDGWITLYSEGFSTPFKVHVDDLEKREEHDTARLIRGIVACMKEKKLPVGGFNATVTSNVLVGSGLSSSASFEVLVCAIIDGLYGGMSIDPLERAMICQWAENHYMDKPSGLMDQTACSNGGMVHINFGHRHPKVNALNYDFSNEGYSLVVMGAGGSHDDLTHEYAAIPNDMFAVAQALGGKVLHDVLCEQIMADVAMLREKTSERAVLRAMHFCDENRRVVQMVKALNDGDLQGFFKSIVDSGESSWKLLQNVYVGGSAHQPLALALEVSRRLLEGSGAWRIHGGGFAGTILAFVPDHLLAEYINTMNGIFGDHACLVLDIRSQGAVEVKLR